MITPPAALTRRLLNFAVSFFSEMACIQKDFPDSAYAKDLADKNYRGILAARKWRMAYELTFLEKYAARQAMSDDYYRWKKNAAFLSSLSGAC